MQVLKFWLLNLNCWLEPHSSMFLRSVVGTPSRELWVVLIKARYTEKVHMILSELQAPLLQVWAPGASVMSLGCPHILFGVLMAQTMVCGECRSSSRKPSVKWLYDSIRIYVWAILGAEAQTYT